MRYKFRGKRVDTGGSIDGTWLTLLSCISEFKGLFLCKCGNTTEQYFSNITNGRVKSCGCLRHENLLKRNTKHGKHGTRLYRIWNGMRKRCNNPNATDYKNYGLRGIRVCNEWAVYLRFEDWALENGYADSLTIDRINVNGNYEPSNCRWITKAEQSQNRRKRTDYPNRDSKGRFVSIDNPELMEVE